MKLWEVTGGEREKLEAERQAAEKLESIKNGLVRCPVCKEAAKVVEFGLKGEGIWIGCDRSPECARNIEFHLVGWSIEDAAREWNSHNSGIYGAIRRVKQFFERHFGELARKERAIKREREREAKERRSEMERIFGEEVQEKPKGNG